MEFRLIDEEGLAEYETWWTDAELRRRIERPTRVWFDYVRQTPGCFAWLIYEDGSLVGQVQLEPYLEQIASFGLVVKPELRGQGYGKRILRALLERDEMAPYARLEVTIEPDNTASLRCFESAGFRQQEGGPDWEGFLHFVFVRRE